MNSYTLINKKFVLSQDAKISIKERACKFGDGIFETCKISNSVIYDFNSHLVRLKRGLKALQIDAQISDLEDLCYKLIKKNGAKNGILRVSISRGVGSMGYLPKENMAALVVIETMQERKVKSDKIVIGVSRIKLLKKQSFLQGCKTMQSLDYVLAKMEARKKGFFDDIMINSKGYIAETSSSNLFFVKNNKIYTPSTNCDILPGTIRQKIIKNFCVEIVKSKIDRLKNVDEVFLTNSNLLVIGVDEIVISGKKIKLKKDISNEILDFLEKDVEKNCKKQ